MTKQERKEKIQELTSMILDLKMVGGKVLKLKILFKSYNKN
jgi:hypothetical protein